MPDLMFHFNGARGPLHLSGAKIYAVGSLAKESMLIRDGTWTILLAGRSLASDRTFSLKGLLRRYMVDTAVLRYA